MGCFFFFPNWGVQSAFTGALANVACFIETSTSTPRPAAPSSAMKSKSAPAIEEGIRDEEMKGV